MSLSIQQGRTAAAIGLGVGLIGLGALSVLHRDYSLQWEPVPKDLPAREILGMASGLILIAAGSLLMFTRTRVWGALIAAAFIGFWVVALHLPKALAHAGSLTAWLQTGEVICMTAGAFLMFREQQRGEGARDLAARAAVLVFGATLLMFGALHFLYADFTAAMVPAWMPMRLALAWLTGAIHVANGLAVLSWRWRRWGALGEAAMMTAFVALVHIPRVAAHPGDRTELTLLFVAIILSSVAWTVATSRAVRP